MKYGGFDSAKDGLSRLPMNGPTRGTRGKGRATSMSGATATPAGACRAVGALRGSTPMRRNASHSAAMGSPCRPHNPPNRTDSAGRVWDQELPLTSLLARSKRLRQASGAIDK
jgi:hypothetical protein